ncbi:MAG: hypothetical protein A3D92_11255 [Bacteroidetes bacterium RIFCSPHIGHO2_02_FULL_44_7]|nr:MAG: hypothetical protein A3D92_11255 [Bacteroidetes bacterium RIFCSPHIGHO2_02_FULL_44_7]
MKLKLSALCLSIVVFSSQAQVPDSQPLTNTTRPMLVKPSQGELVIRLASNGTTGYLWFLTYYDHALLTLEGHHYIAPPVSKMVGVPGVEEWHFKVSPSAFLAPQLSTVNFVHMQPWVLPLPAETKVAWLTIS